MALGGIGFLIMRINPFCSLCIFSRAIINIGISKGKDRLSSMFAYLMKHVTNFTSKCLTFE
jgi:hypothetical protein